MNELASFAGRARLGGPVVFSAEFFSGVNAESTMRRPQPLFPRRASVLLPAVLATAMFGAACDKAKDDGGEVLKRATKAVDLRSTAVRDYALSGTATNLGTQKAVQFTYAFAQPTFAKATLGEEQVTAFDGNAVVMIDHAQKIARRQDAKGMPEEQLLMTLNALFADFVVEGWRPPLLRPHGMSARVEPAADGDRWVISVPIDDDTLAEQRLVLRAADGAFLEKAFLDKSGKAVARVHVVEELKDPATGLSFPKVWERQGPEGSFRMALDSASVNAGLAKDQFTVALPEGYRAGP